MNAALRFVLVIMPRLQAACRLPASSGGRGWPVFLRREPLALNRFTEWQSCDLGLWYIYVRCAWQLSLAGCQACTFV